ncbi:hypothetical protein F511_18774 [Dorcoceras hygrometricum]|uniref:Uncharacterized protein n=1 Tax=Dorcoceras hygrometricum TaxID=472368 RepID=A0A2Z7ADH1_9LAMI|nr:hypothetical protein F511_18774 [Dorcoceras hygrometricum]
MVKRLETSPHDPLGITDSACKNKWVMVSVQYGPFNTNIPIRSTTIGKSRIARDPITMHTSWRSNSDIACVTRTSDLIHSTNGNHLESPNEGSSIDHQFTIHLHAQNITMSLPMKRDVVMESGSRALFQLCVLEFLGGQRCDVVVRIAIFELRWLLALSGQLRLWISWRKIAKTSPFCSLLAYASDYSCRSDFPGFSAGRGVYPAGGTRGGG